MPVADAVLSLAPPRRRLRHHRLLRNRPAARDAGRLLGADPHRQRPRHSGDRGPRAQPHLQRAPVVPVGARVARLALPRTGTCGATRSPRSRPGGVVFPDKENSNWALRRRRPASGICTASTRTSPTSTSRTRRCGTSSRRWPGTGSTRGSPASAWTPCRSCSSRPACRRARSWTRTSCCATSAAISAAAGATRSCSARSISRPTDLRKFFGDEDGDELHMAFNFPVNQAMYLALARGEAAPVEDALARPARHPRGLPVGELRAQPRRADARPAERG